MNELKRKEDVQAHMAKIDNFLKENEGVLETTMEELRQKSEDLKNFELELEELEK